MMADEKIKNSSELEFVVFCIENVAAKLGMDAERVYQAFTATKRITAPNRFRKKAVTAKKRPDQPFLTRWHKSSVR